MMGENTKIEWTDHTFNPWVGCTKVAPGCLNCYAERDFDKRRHFAQWGPNGTRVVTIESNWAKPLKWNRDAEAAGVRSRVFCASLADVFEDWTGPMVSADGTGRSVYRSDAEPFAEETMQDVRKRLFDLIDDTPWLGWQLVTKRPQNVRKMWPDYSYHACVTGDCPHWYASDCDKNKGYRENVWLLTSVSDQHTADQLIPPLLECRDLVPVLGLSIEPLLGPVDLRSVTRSDGWTIDALSGVYSRHHDEGPDHPAALEEHGGGPRINWVIVGGESGPGARPMHPQWVRDLRDQCQIVEVPFFFKQWGEWLPHDQEQYQGAHFSVAGHKFDDDHLASRVGKKTAGRVLDGVTWEQFPE